MERRKTIQAADDLGHVTKFLPQHKNLGDSRNIHRDPTCLRPSAGGSSYFWQQVKVAVPRPPGAGNPSPSAELCNATAAERDPESCQRPALRAAITLSGWKTVMNPCFIAVPAGLRGVLIKKALREGPEGKCSQKWPWHRTWQNRPPLPESQGAASRGRLLLVPEQETALSVQSDLHPLWEI